MAFDSGSTRAIVLLYKDSTVHLCLDSYYTYYLTAEMLISFLSSPTTFLDIPIDIKYDSSALINPTDMPLDKLPGVTLATFSYSRNLTIIFPEVLRHTLSLLDSSKRNEKIYMRSFIAHLDLADAKSFLLRYFLDFAKDVDNGTITSNTFNIDEESFCSVMREIFNASISFAPPKPPERTVDQRLNEAVQQTVIEKKADNYKIPLPDYARRYGLIYNKVLDAARDGKFNTVVKEGRNYLIDFREKPPKYLLQGKEATKTKNIQAPILPIPANVRVSPEEMRKQAREKEFYSNLTLKYIASQEELDFYLSNNYHEVIWDDFHYLICDIDLNLKDGAGRTNEQRIMEDKNSPVTLNPDTNEFMEIHLHHLGQRESVLVPIESHIHSKYHSLFHTTEPLRDMHTSAFETTKKNFWRKYVTEIKKHGTFDKIPYFYPKHTPKK